MFNGRTILITGAASGLGRAWGGVGRSWGVLGSSWALLGASWGGLVAVLGSLGAHVSVFEGIWGIELSKSGRPEVSSV